MSHEPGERAGKDGEIQTRIRCSLSGHSACLIPAVESLVHLMQTHGVVYDALSEAVAPFGLSLAQLNLLKVLVRAEGRHLPMSEIGEQMCVTRTNITKLVDGLERLGLVRRASLAADRRVVLAELTEDGQRLLGRVTPDYLCHIGQLWDALTPPECEDLTRLLIKLRRSVEACSVTARPHGRQAIVESERGGDVQ